MSTKRNNRDRGQYRNYNDQDDRVGSSRNDGGRRVSFKHQGGRNVGNRKNGNRQQGWDTKHIRSLINSNDDIDMTAHLTNRTGEKNVNRNGGRRAGKRTLRYLPTGYYRIEVRYGSRFEKDYLLKTLASHIKPSPLIPLDCKITGKDFVFAVSDHTAAEKILDANNKLTLNNGWKINVIVRPFSPLIEIDEKLTVAIKKALATRYNVATKALDLTQFQLDPAFLANEIICALNRSNVMSFVIELLAEFAPDLVALNLNKNGISAIDHLKTMIEKLPQLRILHLANNMIRDVKQLDSLKGLKLEEIRLQGNTLAAQFVTQEDYVSDLAMNRLVMVLNGEPVVARVRANIPTLRDDADLEKPITFDLEDDEVGKLPTFQLSFMCDVENGAAMARTFIEQYYQIFDSGDRSSIAQAYHDNAQFSLLCYHSPSDTHSMFSNYAQDNRNLIRVTNQERRAKLLKIGKQAIVEALKRFPETEHDPTTFVVDLVFFTPALIQLLVGGLYKEKGKGASSSSSVKHFSRSFVIVPVGSGLCIVNEELCIQTPTSAQLKTILSKSKEPTTTALTNPPAPTPVSNGLSPDLLLKQQLVTELSNKSGMNLVWSEKCLNETNWNIEQAVFAFLQLREAGTIPMEAFHK